jgi:hypothetical protein
LSGKEATNLPRTVEKSRFSHIVEDDLRRRPQILPYSSLVLEAVELSDFGCRERREGESRDIFSAKPLVRRPDLQEKWSVRLLEREKKVRTRVRHSLEQK